MLPCLLLPHNNRAVLSAYDILSCCYFPFSKYFLFNLLLNCNITSCTPQMVSPGTQQEPNMSLSKIGIKCKQGDRGPRAINPLACTTSSLTPTTHLSLLTCTALLPACSPTSTCGNGVQVTCPFCGLQGDRCM